MLPMTMTTVLATKQSALPGKRRSQAGFTFIEMLTVTVLIAVMVSIAVVSYINASKSTRDARRKQDLSQMQFALEAYKQTHGEFPDSGVGCGSWAYPGCSSSGDWIIGMAPEYIVTLPRDPKQNGGANMADPLQFSYRYQKISDTQYYLTAKLENTTDSALNGTLYGLDSTLYVVTEAK